MDYLEDFQNHEGAAITSHCQIKLPFEVKQDFAEEIITFEGNKDALYCLRLCPPSSQYSTRGSRVAIHIVKSTDDNKITAFGTAPHSIQ